MESNSRAPALEVIRVRNSKDTPLVVILGSRCCTGRTIIGTKSFLNVPVVSEDLIVWGMDFRSDDDDDDEVILMGEESFWEPKYQIVELEVDTPWVLIFRLRAS